MKRAQQPDNMSNTKRVRSFDIADGGVGHSFAEFEDYNTTSEVYDVSRVAVGIDIILAQLEKHNILPRDAVVLDGGCGTGNALFKLQPHVGHITGLELNPGMLAQSEKKLAEKTEIKNVTLIQGSLLEALPFEDASFDLIVCNQVIHHLDSEDDVGVFPNVRHLTKEYFRVCKPGGLVIINHCDPDQNTRTGFWWMDLIPRAVAQYGKHLIPSKMLEEFYRDAGFFPAYTVPCAEPLQGHTHFNLAGPLSPVFREQDSTWALVTQEELSAGLKKLQDKLDQGTVGAWFNDLEKLRLAKGQTSFIIGLKAK